MENKSGEYKILFEGCGETGRKYPFNDMILKPWKIVFAEDQPVASGAVAAGVQNKSADENAKDGMTNGL